jgi:capsular polysaccharide biosynthesis protein
MPSPRRFAKSLQFHARGAYIRALGTVRRVPWLRRALRLPSNRPLEPLRDGDAPGVRVTLLEPAARFRRPLPLFAEGSETARPFFAARTLEETAAAYVVELEGGIGWGHPTAGVFTRERRFVPALTHDPSGGAFHTAWTRWSFPRPRQLPGRTLYLVTPEATDNYHHWLIDLLPRLGQVQRAGYDLSTFDQVIVNHSARRYQLATLEKLGLAPERVIAAHPALFIQAEQLVVPSLKPENQTLPPADVAFLRRTFLGDRAPARPGGGRRLFLSRADAGYRRLHNETDLHPLLRAHDFEIVTPAGLDVAGQARLMAEAAVVAGPAGAAFANLVFASAPARVVEIAPPQWLAAFHWMISARLGLEHTLVLGEGPVMRGVPDVAARQADILFPAERLTPLLRRSSLTVSA